MVYRSEFEYPQSRDLQELFLYTIVTNYCKQNEQLSNKTINLYCFKRRVHLNLGAVLSIMYDYKKETGQKLQHLRTSQVQFLCCSFDILIHYWYTMKIWEIEQHQ